MANGCEFVFDTNWDGYEHLSRNDPIASHLDASHSVAPAIRSHRRQTVDAVQLGLHRLAAVATTSFGLSASVDSATGGVTVQQLPFETVTQLVNPSEVLVSQ